MSGPQIDLYAPSCLADAVTTPEEYLESSGGRHRRYKQPRFGSARQSAETAAVSAALLIAVLLGATHRSSGTANRDASAAAASMAKPHAVHQTRHLQGANVIGINAKGQLGSYDDAGCWHGYHGYVTPTEAEDLTHIVDPITFRARGRDPSCHPRLADHANAHSYR